jgi:hypothetical protein
MRLWDAKCDTKLSEMTGGTSNQEGVRFAENRVTPQLRRLKGDNEKQNYSVSGDCWGGVVRERLFRRGP